MQTDEKIQTLHPVSGKKNRRIPVEKYETMKAAILQVLSLQQPTHTELVEKLQADLKQTFHENISWYAMTVKLDLEARGIIKRSGSSPHRYQLRHK